MREAYRIGQVVIAIFIGSAVAAGQGPRTDPSSVVDPTIGTWKLNLGKSSLISIPAYNMIPPKEQTESYRQTDDGRILLSATTVNSDGSVTSSTFSWPAQGGAVQFQQLGPAQARVMTLLAPGEWVLTIMVDGKQGATRHKAVSKDGKTMRHTVKVLDPQGKLVEQVEVYDRQ
jgi:hypothetical protein